jgi:hypothetical protein
MKNLHLIPTDKSSRLQKTKHNNFFLANRTGYEYTDCTAQHIYITNDVDIKEGDYYIDYSIKTLVEIHKLKVKFGSKPIDCKKIILTTDQDLIKDGVQAIDDEFLNWFVNNPSCEEVEVSEDYFKPSNMVYGIDMEPYKIIIPKEEPNKTHYLDELPNMDREVLAKMWEATIPRVKPKQETLEEFINKVDTPADFDQFTFEEGIRVGVKWQQEQDKKLYSVEEVLNLLNDCRGENPIDISKWFEQFKK